MALLKLNPCYKDYIWGGQKLISDFNKSYNGDVLAESWELSCHPDGLSLILNGEFAGKTLLDYINLKGKHILGSNCEKFTDFPILIKFIDAKDDLSIQVHPNDDYALENEKQYGKTEAWYIVDCEENSFLYYGFSKDITEDEFKHRIEEETLPEILNSLRVKKGDIIFIEPGTLHAIGKGIILAEIQQNSNVTYRVYDYGRLGLDGKKRDLHINKALEVTKRSKQENDISHSPHIAKCNYFTIDKLYLDGKIFNEINGNVSNDSFIHFLILDGSGSIKCYNENLHFTKGDSLFLTAGNGKYNITGECEALVTYI